MRTERVTRGGVLVLVGALAAGATGCSSMSNTATGAGIGGALGTALGLGVGAATGNPRTGAVVGGLAGAGLGAAVGHDVDRQDQEKREVRQAAAVAAAQQQPKMGMMDVVHMVQAGHAEQVIINQIRITSSTFQLSSADLDYLKSCNVPDRVIMEMQTARPVAVVAPPRRVVVHEPPAVVYEAPPPVYVVPGPYYCRPRPHFGAAVILR